MIKKILHFTMALLLTGMFLGACTGGDDGESEKGAIRQMTDQVADDMVHKMKSPIDKARAARDQGEDHLDELEGAVEDQEENE